MACLERSVYAAGMAPSSDQLRISAPRFLCLWTLWSFVVVVGAGVCGYCFGRGSWLRCLGVAAIGIFLTNIPIMYWRSQERARARRIALETADGGDEQLRHP